jgi:uncharacterized membrane protein YcgQ (UPF0703/DUF1980 family)
MKKLQNILILSLLIIVMVLLTSTAAHRLASSNPARLNDSTYTQLDIYNILYGKSQEAKLKLLGSNQVTFAGKILNSALLKDDELVVYRIVITCCVADGVPLGIVVKKPANFGTTLHDQDWVKLEGALKLLPLDQINPKLRTNSLFANMVLPEKKIPYFIANKAIKLKKKPGDEYLYP